MSFGCRLAPLALDLGSVAAPGSAPGRAPGTDVLTEPEVEYPTDGSLLPKRYCESADWTWRTIEDLFLAAFMSLFGSEGVCGLGLAGAVLAGVPEGL